MIRPKFLALALIKFVTICPGHLVKNANISSCDAGLPLGYSAFKNLSKANGKDFVTDKI